jgi:hypothetical protein
MWEAADWDPDNRPEADPVDAAGRAKELAGVAEAGICPRCDDPLVVPGEPQPCGSTFTSCRCLPICSRCHEREATYQDQEPPWTETPWFWPVDEDILDVEATIAGIADPDTEQKARRYMQAWDEALGDDQDPTF